MIESERGGREGGGKSETARLPCPKLGAPASLEFDRGKTKLLKQFSNQVLNTKEQVLL